LKGVGLAISAMYPNRLRAVHFPSYMLLNKYPYDMADIALPRHSLRPFLAGRGPLLSGLKDIPALFLSPGFFCEDCGLVEKDEGEEDGETQDEIFAAVEERVELRHIWCDVVCFDLVKC
jgi:hypothetical protein